ncbi:hypothetical protein CRE_05166 [Caenorhabditis remanei]|uniref:Uncharacterized protein n=1 Tax=Caenorhabditis remanei TaxID=31234 RepID=E3N6E5_CAERE|nr:hypothetical protein CRE_05166 [Caenorhabditis remanei]
MKWRRGKMGSTSWSIFDVLERVAPETGSASSLNKLKAKLGEVKEATQSEYNQIVMSNKKMSKKWNEMRKKLRDRLKEAEQAVLKCGVFEESMNDLERWVDKELQRYEQAEHRPVFGDIDKVRQLVDEERRRVAERTTKKNGVKKADALFALGVDEKDSIAHSKERLVENAGGINVVDGMKEIVAGSDGTAVGSRQSEGAFFRRDEAVEGMEMGGLEGEICEVECSCESESFRSIPLNGYTSY